MWDELDRKVRAKQSISATHLWQLLQESRAELSSVYLQSLMERMPKICEGINVDKCCHFDESKVEDFLSFSFNLYLMWPKKTCI